MLRFQISVGARTRYTATSVAIAVVAYEDGMDPGPTKGDFCIDAASGSASKWNVCAGQVFADDFCAADYPEAAGKGFADVLTEFRFLLPVVSAGVAKAAGFENLESYRRFSRSFAGRLRAHRKVESRLRAAGKLNDSDRFMPIVRKLVEDDGMSCDEQDMDGHVYAVSPTWRSASATKWLRNLDNAPRPLCPHRVSGEAPTEGRRGSIGSHVPRSLPANFYNHVYLHNLDEGQYAHLNPQPAIDIEF